VVMREMDGYFARIIRGHRRVELSLFVHLSDNMYPT
jgi:hypothetical protein